MNTAKLISVISLLVLLNSGVNKVTAQVSFAIPAISSPIVKTEMLWNMVLISQQPEPARGKIKVVAKDVNGQIVYSALSSEITLSNGAKTINYSSLLPFSNIYASVNIKNSLLKVGNYLACYSFIKATQSDEFISLGDDCIDFGVEPLTPPMLNLPEDRSQVLGSRPNLNWLPPTPFNLFDNLKYECKVVVINEGQTANEAIASNTPAFFSNSLLINNTSIPSSIKALEEGKDYAWQVVAYDGNYSVKSEIWKFSVIKDSVKQIIENSAFITLKPMGSQLGIMHQGYIKILINNYTPDSEAKLLLFEEGKANAKPLVEKTVTIKQGDNFIVTELSNKVKLDAKKVYQLIWLNSKNEKWSVRYRPIYYN